MTNPSPASSAASGPDAHDATGASTPMPLAERIRAFLAQPVDAASLAVFRIGLGLAVSISMFLYLVPGSRSLADFFLDPDSGFVTGQHIYLGGL